jgi:4-amino-4-deoxy-L-arabinose transferase-like glycosyltransferase
MAVAEANSERDEGRRLSWAGYVAIAAVVGLALRIAYVLTLAEDPPGLGDAAEIHGLANVIADGRGFVSPFAPPDSALPTAHKPPLYPFALALVTLSGGSSPVAHQLASAIIGTGIVIVVALIGRRVAGHRAGLVAAALAATYPAFVTRDGSLHSETPYTLLVGAAVLAALWARERPTAARFCVLGAIVGLTALTRSEGLLLLMLLAVPVAASQRQHRTRNALAAAVTCLLVLTPWLVRCWAAFDRPVAITTSSGDLVAGANCDPTYGGALIGEWAFRCVLGAKGANEADIAEHLRRRGFTYARDHRSRLPSVVAARLLRPWGAFHPGQEVALQRSAGGGPTVLGWLGIAWCWALLALSVPGAWLLRRRKLELWVVGSPFVLVLIVTATSYGILRFRAAGDVTLVVLAAVTIEALLRRRAVTDTSRVLGTAT